MTATSEILSSSTDKPLFEFSCSNPDFTIRTVPDGKVFEVNKARMAVGSRIFRDMFFVCTEVDTGDIASSGEAMGAEGDMEIHEHPDVFALFLAVVHGDRKDANPSVESEKNPAKDQPQPIVSTPLPDSAPTRFFRPLWAMFDKYDVPSEHQQIAEAWLKQNAEQDQRSALEVYAVAHQLNLTHIASHTSQYLLSRPLKSYTLAEVEAYFPSAKAYHRLHLLHEHRIMLLRGILLKEDIFPHDYGLCPKHGESTRAMWAQRQRDIAHRITAGTNLPAEVAIIKGSLAACHKCNRACNMAVKMLEYKTGKVPKTFDLVPGAV